MRPALVRVDDPDAGTFWIFGVGCDPDPDGAYDVTGALAPPFFCRGCQRGYVGPPNIHFEIDWRVGPDTVPAA